MPGPYSAYIDGGNRSVVWSLFSIYRFCMLVFRLWQGWDDEVVIWLDLLFIDGEVWLLQNRESVDEVV